MSASPSQLCTLHWEDIQVSTVAGRPLLRGISGIVKPGELCALMGASGAGKTTLLNTLLFRNTKGLIIEGGIYVNGQQINRDITSVSSYVQQEDLFVGNLTVEEHLTIQARMRLSGTMDRAERKNRVEEVMRAMLLETSKNSRIGIPGIRKGISGGEMKRLAFATEVLTNPSILFCDEPTTGLDSHMAMIIVKQLESLANAGMNIVCTIHQPSSEIFELFDKVVFLSQGRMAFSGTPPEAVSFFASSGHIVPDHTNPADFYIQCLAIEPSNPDESKARANEVCDKFQESEYNEKLMEGIRDAQRPRKLRPQKSTPICILFLALWKRYMLDNLRNPAILKAKVAQKVFMGVFLSALYWQQTLDQDGVQHLKGALFYYISEMTYSTIYGIQTYLPGDFPLVVREYHDGIYPTGCYYIARILSYVPIFTIDGIIMVVISYFSIGFTLSSFPITILTTVLVEWCVASVGIMICSITPSYSIAVSITGPLLTVFSITGGLFTNVAAMPDWNRWVQYLSWFRYGYESLIVGQWTDESYSNIPCTSKDAPVTNQYCYKSGEDVISLLSFSTSNLFFNLYIMGIYVIVVYIIGYIGLVYRVQKAR